MCPTHTTMSVSSPGQFINSPTFTQARFPPQTPPVHTSAFVHALPSLQAVPFAWVAKLHVPSPLQVPACWHGPGAAQLYAVPAQTPPVHTSVFVHALPSLHAVPLALFAKLHVPSPLQVPACWH